MATKHQPSQSAKNFTHPTYGVIEARMADARRARGATLGWHGLWPAGIAAGIGVALLAIVTVPTPADRASHFSSPANGVDLRSVSAVVDPEEGQRRICVTAEVCIDLAPPSRNAVVVAAQDPAVP
jgi:hypothetical protein